MPPEDPDLIGNALSFAKGAGEGAKEGVTSMAQGLWSLAKGGYHVATDPQAREQAWQTTQNLADAAKQYGTQAIADPAKPFRDARDKVQSVANTFEAARAKAAADGTSAEFYGKLTGRGAFEAGTFAVGAGEVGMVGKAGEAAEVAGDLSKAGKLAEGAGEAANVGAKAGDATSAGAKAADVVENPALKDAGAGASATTKCPYLSEAKSDAIVNLGKGNRPDPSTYLPKTYIDSHLNQFQGGSVKIVKDLAYPDIGPPGGSTFVLPKQFADDVLAKANGDPAKLEQLLSLKPGDLGANPLRIDIPAPSGLKMASGNEAGANADWIPGGFTKGGVPEAVIDSVPHGQYTSAPAFNPGP